MLQVRGADFFYITIRLGESIQERTIINIYIFCVADFVPSCNVLITFDMLILDTKELNRIIIGIDKVGAKFTLMFAFQEISCQTIAVLL